MGNSGDTGSRHVVTSSRAGLRTAFVWLILVLSLLVPSQRVFAIGKLIDAVFCADTVFDDARHVLYLTLGDSVLRYDTRAEAFLPPLKIGGYLRGIDLSPDGNTLAVADTNYTSGLVWIYLVDLQTDQVTKVPFTRSPGEGGTFTVAYGSDGRLLVSSTYLGSGLVPLRRYDPAAGTTDVIATVRQDSMLRASADGSVIAFAEGNSSEGPWGCYRVSDGSVVSRQGATDGTGWFNYEIAASRDGSQYAIPTYGGTFVYDGAFANIATIGVYAWGQPMGVVYSPTKDIVYFAWATTNNVVAYDTTSLTQIDEYDFENFFDHPANNAFIEGRLKMSRDGKLLFCTVHEGVRYILFNKPPAADPQSIVTDEDKPADVTLSGSDPDADSLTYTVMNGPTHGKLSGTAPKLVYTPDAKYTGKDEFAFTAYDGYEYSSQAVVGISVNPVNHAPSADPQSVVTDEDKAVAITLSGSDSDGDALTYAVCSGPSHGKLTGTAPNLTYTPDAKFSGNDQFAFTTDDGKDTSGQATVSIAVSTINHSPVASSQSATTDEDKAVDITLSGSDSDGDVLTYAVSSSPTHGKLSGTAPKLTYTPDAKYSGTDQFAFTANDGKDTSSPATVSITVKAVNHSPVANSQSVVTDQDKALAITLSGSDADGDMLTYAVTTAPTHGKLTGAAPKLTYTPDAQYAGTDQFAFTANDGKDTSSPVTVSITVNKGSDPPDTQTTTLTLTADDPPTLEDTPVGITVSCSGGNGGPFTYSVTDGLAHGVLSGTAPNMVYTPAANYSGADQFTVKASDGTAVSNAMTVGITVVPVNDAPSFDLGCHALYAKRAPQPECIPGWARHISAGPADEADQTVYFDVSTTNTDFFDVQPAIDPSGTLTFTPAKGRDGKGMAIVRVVAHDSGGTANGGVDQSTTQVFAIIVGHYDDRGRRDDKGYCDDKDRDKDHDMDHGKDHDKDRSGKDCRK